MCTISRLQSIVLTCLVTTVWSDETLPIDSDGHCQLDNSKCQMLVQRPPCLKYDPKKFQTSPSMFTYFPMGRLGNTISAYLTLLWLKKDHNLDVYLEREAFDRLNLYFENIGGGIKVLEDSICDWREFGFPSYEENVELLTGPEWKYGKAVNIHPDTEEAKKNKPQYSRKFANIYRKENREALTFKSSLRNDANTKFKEIAEKMGKKPWEVTYVGLHNRRTDYLDFRKNVLGLKKLSKNFFLDAMDYFREEFDHVAFVYISDDMQWGKKNLRKVENIFFLGCGDSEDPECIGQDLVLLGSCNHTISTDGSFGFWASILAGGEIYTEYGLIVPEAFFNA